MNCIIAGRPLQKAQACHLRGQRTEISFGEDFEEGADRPSEPGLASAPRPHTPEEPRAGCRRAGDV
jgi:hypothetical protein